MKTMETGIGADAAKLAGLQVDTLQKVRSGQITLIHWEWFNRLTREERDRFAGTAIMDDWFRHHNTFTFTVPADYDHGTHLARFAKENRKKFYFYNDAITDANYARVSNKLVTGKTYEVEIFEITRRVSPEDCLAFLKTQKAIFVGAQGISVAWQQAEDKFPKGKWLVSFDKKDALWEDADGSHRVPGVRRSSDGYWSFFLGHFGSHWYDDNCLFCLRDVS